MSTETLCDDLVGNSTNVNLSIVNVVATANVNQPVDLPRLNGTSWGPYDASIYRSGYARDRDMIDKVIVFNSGKLISVGTKSLKQASAEEEARRGEDEGAPEAGPPGIRLPEGQVSRQGHSQGPFKRGDQGQQVLCP